MTVRRGNFGDIRAFCPLPWALFGRFSLDTEGLATPVGMGENKYKTFPDVDGILPITDEEYLGTILSLACAAGSRLFMEKIRWKKSGLHCQSSRRQSKTATGRSSVIISSDFFKDHCKIYQKRPIYYRCLHGHHNGFKPVIYLTPLHPPHYWQPPCGLSPPDPGL